MYKTYANTDLITSSIYHSSYDCASLYMITRQIFLILAHFVIGFFQWMYSLVLCKGHKINMKWLS